MRLSDYASWDDSGPIFGAAASDAAPTDLMRTAPCNPATDRVVDDDHAIATVTRLTEALRRSKRGQGAGPAEVVDAEAALAARIRAHLPRGQLQVTLTNNRFTMISVRRSARAGGRKHYDVRLHCMFADADPVIARALARYVADNDRDASRVLGDFIDANAEAVRGRRKVAAPVLITTGDQHDLRAIFDELNDAHFGGAIDASITWGARTGVPRRRASIKMGSYSVEERLIRIHRALDRAFVPRFFVEWIVFHEMLHQVHDIKLKNGRREFHSAEFLAAEAAFPRYAEARAWERANLDALLTY